MTGAKPAGGPAAPDVRGGTVEPREVVEAAPPAGPDKFHRTLDAALARAAEPAAQAHDFGLRGIPGSRDLIVTCATHDWESEPVHLSNAELMRERHRSNATAERHDLAREFTPRCVRVVCSCGDFAGRWRSRTAFLVGKQLHSDEGEHIHAVRRANP